MNEKQTLPHVDSDMGIRHWQKQSREVGYGSYIASGKFESFVEKHTQKPISIDGAMVIGSRGGWLLNAVALSQ